MTPQTTTLRHLRDLDDAAARHLTTHVVDGPILFTYNRVFEWVFYVHRVRSNFRSERGRCPLVIFHRQWELMALYDSVSKVRDN